MHTNIFAGCNTEREAYESLQRDSKSNVREIQIMDLVLIIAAFYLLRNLERWDAIAVVALGISFMVRLNTFVDNSNRNFFLHMLDWHNFRQAQKSLED
ncbi:MAG TPA: hypothetical protein VMN38_11725 [Sphingomicrobium sp.]|nr:hypothetical protein [Sphingomicrobium sp.]